MSERRCRRAWEAEAIEDGQLAGIERASFERHAAACAECAHEVDALASLRRLMRQVGPPEPSLFELRRTRARLLKKAHAKNAPVGGATRNRWGVAALVVTLLVALGATGHMLSSHGGDGRGHIRSAQSYAPAAFDVVDVAGARVTTRTEGTLTRAALAEGIAAFHVEHVGSQRRFLVDLPDGEIEVRGTRFVVSVQSGHTQSVDVSEGVVVLRLRGEPERTLVAGERWTESRVAPDSSSNGGATLAVRDAPVGSRRTPPLLVASTPKPVTSESVAARSPSAPATAPPADRAVANQRFAAAVAAFRADEYAEADGLLDSFVHTFSGDARCEDASFLRLVARSRLNDPVGAASLAREYLRDYPHGFRHREAESLARGGGDLRSR